jgi:SPP1 gp7 family putative phage head morphogenesis protein
VALLSVRTVNLKGVVMPSKHPPLDFGPKKRLQKEYEKGVKQIVGKVLAPRLPEQSYEEWLTSIAARSREYDVQEASETLARRMVKWTSILNARTWREAAARSQRSRFLYGLFIKEMQGATGARVSQLVRENARYISSIPLEAATKLVEEVQKATAQGARPGTIAKMAKTRFPELLKSRMNLIARTETAKASTALTQARCADLGLDWYEWLTSEDARVRKSHKKMNGVLVSWAQPPSPEHLMGEASTLGNYHAGSSPNCRCSQAPLLTLNDVSWPHRVYWNGRVSQMTKVQFRQIANVEERAA